MPLTSNVVPAVTNLRPISPQTHTQVPSINHEVHGLLSGIQKIDIGNHSLLKGSLQSLPLIGQMRKKFEDDGGIVNPTLQEVKDIDMSITKVCWIVDLDQLEVEVVKGIKIGGFQLWKLAYSHIPEYLKMSEKEATIAGLYPYVYYRNTPAKAWTADYIGGKIVGLSETGSGDMMDILNQIPGGNILDKLSKIGVGLWGQRYIDMQNPMYIGQSAILGSEEHDSYNQVGYIPSILCFDEKSSRDLFISSYGKKSPFFYSPHCNVITDSLISFPSGDIVSKKNT